MTLSLAIPRCSSLMTMPLCVRPSRVCLSRLACGYAVGFAAALLTAAVVAGLSAIVVAIRMRLARGRSSSQTAFAVEEEERSVSKPIVSAASVRAAPLVYPTSDEPIDHV